jgi:hypothetical protein
MLNIVFRKVTDVIIVGSDICGNTPNRYWADAEWLHVMRNRAIKNGSNLRLFYQENLCRAINFKLGERVLLISKLERESWHKRCILAISYGSKKSLQVCFSFSDFICIFYVLYCINII